MLRVAYSFASPPGFALAGGATSTAGASMPLAGGRQQLAGGLPAPAGALASLADVPSPPLAAPAPLAGPSTPPPAAPAPLLGPSNPPAGAPTQIAREIAPAAERGWPEGLPIGLRQDQERTRSREALMRSGTPPRRGRIEEGAAPHVLSRLSPRPAEPQPVRAPDMEELCEELIARLRRELLVERERMGTALGA
jgi:hypothetical protein